MRLRLVIAALASLLIAVLMSGGCTEPPLGWPGAGRNYMLPAPVQDASALLDNDSGPQNLPALCAPAGVMCRKNHDCCSEVCTGLNASVDGGDAGLGTCLENDGGSVGGPPICIPPGVICGASQDCCFLPPAHEGYCGPQGCGNTPSQLCVPTFIFCTENSDCCFPMTDGGEGGIPCIANVCGEPAPGATGPLCVPYGVICHNDTDCCVGKCSENAADPTHYVCDIPK